MLTLKRRIRLQNFQNFSILILNFEFFNFEYLTIGNSQLGQAGVCCKALPLLFKEWQGYTSLTEMFESYWCPKDSR